MGQEVLRNPVIVETPIHEKRRYVRLNTVFPVEFEIFVPEDGRSRFGLLQGFTRDVSEGGLCLELKTFGPQIEQALQGPGPSLKLFINPPFSRRPIEALGTVVWIRKDESLKPVRYWIGVAYSGIDPAARGRIIRFAHRQYWIPRLIWVTAVAMLGVIAALSIHGEELRRENRRLVHSLVQSARHRSDLTENLKELTARRESLNRELADARRTIEENVERQKSIADELRRVVGRRRVLEERRRELAKADQPVLEAALEQMYVWLYSHQNLKTGLVVSFEGDPGLSDTAFTYDQALAAQAFLLFGDVKKADLILSFYDRRAARQGGAFFNAYGTHDGHPSENVIHAGPNLWLGLAAIQYDHRVRDPRALNLARSIGDWVLTQQDPEGGVPGGPGVGWYSTEHNLDAYAFLGLLAGRTGEVRYRDAQARVLAWIKKYSFSLQARRVNRGKGDATIATDTLAWAIAAVGPEKLSEIGFRAEDIMGFAEEHCEVSVPFRRPDGSTVNVRGFDFAKAQHVGRGGVVSTEWTAQMIVSYRALGRFFGKRGDPDRAARYDDKAEFYLNELKKMVITSPSKTGQGRGCLPYASMENVDTGHGWRTPRGASTGSVAGTAYGLFAWKGYNPFELSNNGDV